MDKVNNKVLISGVLVIGIIFVIVGATFAFYASSTTNTINGNVGVSFNMSMTITAKKVGNLIPLRSSLVSRTIQSNSKCVDLNSNDICSYYQVDFTNSSGSAQTMNGYVKTETGTTYTSDHLHFMLFNSSYQVVSGDSVISHTTNSKNYLKATTGNDDLSFSVPVNTSTYYLVVWINDDDTANQLEDVNKTFVGSLVFESSGSGGTLSARFQA